ncbi:MAG: hydantoinase/oxoprolinase family protein, partial [Nioella sp.]
AARLCEKLGIDRCLVPVGAGVGSAIGFLRAPFSFEATRSVFTRIGEFDPARVRALFAEMEAEARGFVLSCAPRAETLTEYKVYMRYAGQGWEIPVPLTPEDAANPDAATFLQRFEADYTRLFGRSVEGMEAEITVWSVNAATPVPPVAPVESAESASTPSPQGWRDLFDPALGRYIPAAIHARAGLIAGATVEGPAVIVEDETTIVLPTSRRATARPDGCIDIHAKEPRDD